MTRWVEAGEVAAELRPGMTVFVAGATAEPTQILAALAAEPEVCAGVRFVSVSVPGVNRADLSALHPEARAIAFLTTPQTRAAIAAGRVEFVPMQYRAVYEHLRGDLPIDLALVQVPELTGGASVSLGLAGDFFPAVAEAAGRVVAEVNPRQPRPADAPHVPAARIDRAVAVEAPLPTLPEVALDEVARAIGAHVAALVPDGACLQIGIGAIPDAVLAALGGHNDLGIHSGMITDRVMALAEAGNITGLRKPVDTGRIVTGVVLGSRRLLEWAGAEPRLAVRPVGYTHDPGVIRRLDDFVAINSALEVDLLGQVNAEVAGGRQVSATGGSIDMARGAALARRGRSIVALRSTAAGGRHSRIVAALARGHPATLTRTDIDHVVTEHGARRIAGLGREARAAALIEIAAPEFRERLRAEWQALNTTSAGRGRARRCGTG